MMRGTAFVPSARPGTIAGVVDVEVLEGGREAVGVALAADLAVGDDVQAGALRIRDRERGGVVLACREIGRFDAPQLRGADARRQRAAQLLAVDQPNGCG